MADLTRRQLLGQGAAAAAWVATLGIPDTVWALQDGEELVTFSDYTDGFKINASPANPTVRCYDLRTLTTWATPADQHYVFHQTTTPQVDAASYRLHIGGFVERPREVTLDQLKARRDRRDEPVTVECSGNSTRPQRMSGLLSNAVWLQHVDVQIDDGEWQPAALEPPRGKYAWRLWTFRVRDLAPGKHMLASRATDANGRVQPTSEDRRKMIASGREDFSIWPREILID